MERTSAAGPSGESGVAACSRRKPCRRRPCCLPPGVSSMRAVSASRAI